MLKESIKDLIVAIAEGDSLSIENNFNSVMASKISDRLDTMRVAVAQGMFGSQVVEESVELEEDKFDHDKAMEIHNKFWDKIEAKLAKKPVKKSDKKPVKEELTLEDFSIEELDEISSKTLDSYREKAFNDNRPEKKK